MPQGGYLRGWRFKIYYIFTPSLLDLPIVKLPESVLLHLSLGLKRFMAQPKFQCSSEYKLDTLAFWRFMRLS